MTPERTLRGCPPSIAVAPTASRSRRRPSRRSVGLRAVFDWLPMVVLALAAGFCGVWRIAEALNQDRPPSAPVAGQVKVARTSVADAPVRQLAMTPVGARTERSIALIP